MYIQEAVKLPDLNDEILDFYRAIGVDMLQVDLRAGVSTLVEGVDLKGDQDLTPFFAQIRERVEARGIKLNTVFSSAWDEITLGQPDMDEKIEAWGRMLEAIGAAGIPHLGWNFKPMGNFRTPSDTGRGGVKYSTFDYAEFMANRPPLHEPAVSEEQMWERMEAFLKAVIPVAERAGVRMALHPDDPPIPEALGGVAQICSTLPQFRRIFDMVPSPNHAMLFCQGCMTELLGPEQVYDAIAEMAAAGRIAWVHFRNVRGQLPRFTEVFIDEGEVDMRRAMQTYRNNGFNGPYMMDHTPHFSSGRSQWLGKAYAIGYIRSLIQTVYPS